MEGEKEEIEGIKYSPKTLKKKKQEKSARLDYGIASF